MLLQISLAVALLFVVLVVWREGLVRRVVLVRIPLLLLLALCVLPWAMPLSRSELFANLVVTEDAVGLFCVNLLAVLAVWVALICAATILKHGGARFDAAPVGAPRWVPPLRARSLPPGALLALPATLAFANAAQFEGARWLPSVLAYGAALLLVPIVGALQRLAARFFGGGSPRWLRRFYLWLPPSLRAGYVDEEGRVLPGHLIAVAVFALNGAVFWIGFVVLAPPEPLVPLPALGFLLLLLMLLCSFLAGAAFFWDRFRVPLLGLLAVVLFVGHQITGSDHFFPLEPGTPTILAAPLDVAARADAPARPLVVVCAAGGGVQAAYWTTCAMTGLHADLGPDFARSLRLVSGVSGGSVGLLYYLERLRARGALLEAADFEAVRAAAQRSVLPAATWGIVYLDLYPVQFSRFRDRAWATEQVWRGQCEELLAGSGLAPARLSDWSAACDEGLLPGVVFNATFMESGQRLLFGSVDVPGDGLSFQSVYPQADIAAVTAARLSATFPFVAPAARAAWRDPARDGAGLAPLHVVDGSYVDNSAVLSALEWLEALLASAVDDGQRVLVVRLEPFPEPRTPAGGAEGWRAGALGPLETTFAAWRTTQEDRWRAALVALERRLGGRFRAFTLRPSGAGTGRFPLSWYLSPDERAATDAAWAELCAAHAYSELGAWFRGD